MIQQQSHLTALQGNVHTEQAILRDVLVGVLYAHREQGPRDLLMKPAQVPWTTRQLLVMRNGAGYGALAEMCVSAH